MIQIGHMAKLGTVLVTGVGRTIGIGATVAADLAGAG